MKGKTQDLDHDLTFSAHAINCVCHSIRSMFRVLGIYNFAPQRKHSVTSNYRLHNFKASLIPFLLLMYDFSLGVFKQRHKSLIFFENEILIVENKFFFLK